MQGAGMAWLYDLRDATQEVLEWATETPCTCAREPGLDSRRCLAHRAHHVLAGLYYYGTPTRRFPRQLVPRYMPVHSVLVAHDYPPMRDRFGFPTRGHDRARCRTWCRDCGAIAPGPCRDWSRGDNLAWFADYAPEPARTDLNDYRSCVWIRQRHFELRPHLMDDAENDLRDSPGEDRRLPPGEHRRSG